MITAKATDAFVAAVIARVFVTASVLHQLVGLIHRVCILVLEDFHDLAGDLLPFLGRNMLTHERPHAFSN